MTEQKYYKFVTRELTDSKRGVIDYSRIGEWISCDDITDADIDGEACGHGLHLMKIPNPRYCQYAVGYLAEGRYLLGEDVEKARFAEIRLIRPLRFSEIFFPGADLHCANLHGANLPGADLQCANLHGANLHGADLHCANLHGANLHGADLRNANLWSANLQCANLPGADLRNANLWSADLRNANLWSANLHGAIIEDVKIDGAIGLSDSIISRIKGEEAEKQ